MATAPELLDSLPATQIRAMTEGDLAEVFAIEHASYTFPWSEGIFRDCLRVGYICRVLVLQERVGGYGVMSMGAGEMHVHIGKPRNQKLSCCVNNLRIFREFNLSELSDFRNCFARNNDNHIALRVCARRVNHRSVCENYRLRSSLSHCDY